MVFLKVLDIPSLITKRYHQYCIGDTSYFSINNPYNKFIILYTNCMILFIMPYADDTILLMYLIVVVKVSNILHL